MIKECNFKRDGTKSKGIYCGFQNGRSGEGFCSGEDNCILYQIYKESQIKDYEQSSYMEQDSERNLHKVRIRHKHAVVNPNDPGPYSGKMLPKEPPIKTIDSELRKKKITVKPNLRIKRKIP